MNPMPSWTTAILLSGLALLSSAAIAAKPAFSETVLEKVARTGKLTAGTRVDAKPFAYKDSDGQWVGYSIDLLEQIRSHLQQQLRRPIKLELVETNLETRVSLLVDNKIDIDCGSTSFTRSHDLDVDFSVGYFVTGTQLLIKTTTGLGTDFSIGVVAGTTNQMLVERLFPVAQLVTFENRASGLVALERDRIDALASDGILLKAMQQSIPASQDYAIFPSRPYDEEAYACMLPENETDFRQTVNLGLLKFMQGALAGDPTQQKILETWFGETGVVPIDQQPLLDFFQRQVSTYAQLFDTAATNGVDQAGSIR